MIKNNDLNTTKPNFHVMPPQISDEDITALFNGIVSIVKKKIELENRAEVLNLNTDIHRLTKQLKEKTAECNRLKNEILYLKSKLTPEI